MPEHVCYLRDLKSFSKNTACLRMVYEGTVLSELSLYEDLSPCDSKMRPAESNGAFTIYVRSEITEYLRGERKSFSLVYEPRGTVFQQKVWQALCRIPYGKTATYGEIAAAVGKPKAARAVGMVCNKNPLMIVVPCHRVIGSDGSLTGYASGLEMKKRLLELERRVTSQLK